MKFIIPGSTPSHLSTPTTVYSLALTSPNLCFMCKKWHIAIMFSSSIAFIYVRILVHDNAYSLSHSLIYQLFNIMKVDFGEGCLISLIYFWYTMALPQEMWALKTDKHKISLYSLLIPLLFQRVETNNNFGGVNLGLEFYAPIIAAQWSHFHIVTLI